MSCLSGVRKMSEIPCLFTVDSVLCGALIRRSNGISLYSTSRNQALSLDRFSFKGGEESVVIEEEQREGLEL